MRNRRNLVAVVPALALCVGLAFHGRTAQAEYFEYGTVVTVNPVNGIASLVNNNSTEVTLLTSGGDAIIMSGNSGGGTIHENGSGQGTDIVFGDINVSTTPDSSYQAISFNFTETLSLADYSQPVDGTKTGSGTVLISGLLKGSIGAGRKVNLSQLQNYAISGSNMIKIGTTTYTVSLNSYVPPGTSYNGTFGAHVTASVVPEPMSAAPAALGLIGLAGYLWRRKRTAKGEVAVA